MLKGFGDNVERLARQMQNHNDDPCPSDPEKQPGSAAMTIKIMARDMIEELKGIQKMMDSLVEFVDQICRTQNVANKNEK